MEFILLSVGKVTTPWIISGLTDFEKRLSKYVRFSAKMLPDVRSSKTKSKDVIKAEEGKSILSEISQADYVVILDEKGLEFTSAAFSKWIEKQMVSGKKRLIFIIGGPYGFSDEVYRRADSKLSLSKMTFTHEMAKLFFTEQLYRAFTILNNEPYHHD